MPKENSLMNRKRQTMLLAALVSMSVTLSAFSADKIKVLIVDGQNNHKWEQTTPIMKKSLEAAELFSVDVATSPPAGEDVSDFRPKFGDYDVVVSNYNGADWSETTQKEFTDYVKSGGGFVVVHAADNSFPGWHEYNRMIGLGGWGGRTEKSGPYVYFDDGRVVRDEAEGRGGNHGAQHEFTVIVRDANHPITKDMPASWLHTKDELYDMLRGPAEDMRVLATAFSPVTKRHEPMILTVRYGNGRIFHTPMGHADYSIQCVGFISTLQRGTEWAATGEVTQTVPEDFPTEKEASSRDF